MSADAYNDPKLSQNALKTGGRYKLVLTNIIDFLKKHKRIAIAVLGVIILLTVLSIALRPERSVANFCKAASEEKTAIIGDHNYEDRLKAFQKLENVAPEDIRADVTAIRKGQQAIVDNPSSSFATEFGLTGAGDRMTKYITSHCSADFWKQ